jgi:putative peptide zinc metalloprotease protein
VPLLWRADLIVQTQSEAGHTVHVVKDPLRSRYFRFTPEEYTLLSGLDGQATREDLHRRFAAQHAPQIVPADKLERLLTLAYRQGLLVSQGAGQGSVLLRRARAARARKWWQGWSHILAWRLPGVAPQPLLLALLPWCGVLFCRTAVVAWIGLLIITLGLLGTEAERLAAEWPDSATFFGPGNWLWLGGSLAMLKVLHELAHGLACQKLGGHCREMGIMLFCFTPCLYCDVSDASMIPQRWHRAAIAAAGMYSDLALAAVASWVWWSSEPGLVRQLALNVMFVGSVGTLLFNLNPLVRCDGYYILSDLLSLPNLHARASHANRRFWSRLLVGQRRGSPQRSRSDHPGLLLYAWSSQIYRTILLVGLGWFLYSLTEPWGVRIVGQFLALVALGGTFWLALSGAGRELLRWREDPHFPWLRWGARTLTLVATLAALLAVPLPRSVHCSLTIEPAHAARVFVQQPGEIGAVLVQPGEMVTPGQKLLVLRNREAELATLRLEQQLQREETRLASLTALELHQGETASQRGATTAALLAAREALAQSGRHLAALELTAPRGGMVWPVARRPRPDTTGDHLPVWSGQPLDTRNEGAFLAANECVALIGDPRHWQATLAVEERYVELVQIGDRVDIFLDQLPGTCLTTTVAALSSREMRTTADQLNQHEGGSLTTRVGADGMERPVAISYEALVEFTSPGNTLAVGGSGKARIHLPWRSLGYRLGVALQRLLEWEL